MSIKVGAKVTLVFAVLIAQTTVLAQTILVEWKTGTITTKDVEADLLKIPVTERADTLKDPRTLLQVIDNLQVYRELAVRAKQNKFNSPDIELSAAIAAERQVGLLYLNAELEKFRNSLGDLTPAAREHFELNKSKYDRPERISASHILLAPKNRTKQEAKILAERLMAQLKTGENFEELARQNTDDSGSKESGGLLGTFSKGMMVKPFEDASFALKKKGDLSSIIETQFGYHIIRLNGREEAGASTFDDVKGEIIEDLAAKAVSRQRDIIVSGIRNDSSLKLNEKQFEEYTGAKPRRRTTPQ